MGKKSRKNVWKILHGRTFLLKKIMQKGWNFLPRESSFFFFKRGRNSHIYLKLRRYGKHEGKYKNTMLLLFSLCLHCKDRKLLILFAWIGRSDINYACCASSEYWPFQSTPYFFHVTLKFYWLCLLALLSPTMVYIYIYIFMYRTRSNFKFFILHLAN